jgi:hypothetical protein
MRWSEVSGGIDVLDAKDLTPFQTVIQFNGVFIS